MKICLIGPSYPFRGGIAHYTTLLFRELAQHHDVRFYAFKRQYPLWLFPGKTDKDNSRASIRDDRIEPVLDSLNPLSWYSVFAKIRAFGPDLLILPWWVAFWALQFWSISKLVKKFTKSKIVFICHNVVEHESNLIAKLLSKFALKMGDYFIVHSEEDLAKLRCIIPLARAVKSFHPTYEIFKQNGWSKEKARQTLGVSGNILLFFGFVRDYKGLSYLIDALPQILRKLDVTLLVAGEFWKNKEVYLAQINRLGIQEKIKIIDKYIPNEEVGLYFAVSDLVVLPYISATGSGIVQLAFGCGRPVVTTKVGSLGEVVSEGKTGYLVDPQDSQSIADSVIDYFSKNKEHEFIQNIEDSRERFSWKGMRVKIEELACERQ